MMRWKCLLFFLVSCCIDWNRHHSASHWPSLLLHALNLYLLVHLDHFHMKASMVLYFLSKGCRSFETWDRDPRILRFLEVIVKNQELQISPTQVLQSRLIPCLGIVGQILLHLHSARQKSCSSPSWNSIYQAQQGRILWLWGIRHFKRNFSFLR